ncbi:Predicted thiol-disulfide oxidoreductase YuxK, DCC family [Mucilaginibacter lappiensis]|uniref:DCC family thiol-disulfide oxidoreductase YuxK n=1 Tax=Mucilaginibacter lappiensis TaxID=354630 RepID=A0ABR6PL77_9SPHI|nr:DCC1-like thiol-disulfide oxidoreductase family protein [Mucilaginibacter lappiensis]MBB6109006.1 putative DCC family thiol-disulfide oxidoreductase YuxK [Mucilaginibacter lappiensis]SIQ71622.1 Predicted thiol-disulfide oxidoreductase YuxK, DCC family [Mucilaginibacter lappiensis]
MAPVLDYSKDIILFDGVCNFCNSYVNYVIAHDKANKFVFAPLQSHTATRMAARFQTDFKELNSVVVIHGNEVYTHSAAVIHIVKNLSTVWLPLAYLAWLVPPFIRNKLYTAFADKRYVLFGQSESCMVPTAQVKHKFLN